MKRALVLSGGGARGSYQVGVWKALRELDIKYDIITGTSVGALNGALMVQDTYDQVVDFWNEIDFKKIFNDPFFQKESINNKKAKIIWKYINAAFFQKGLEISELEKNLNDHLNEDLFFDSNIDYGIVSFDIKNKKPITWTKKEITRDKLKDYIIASATLFPIFKKKEIGENLYVDGGYYDNLPINLAIDMGATEIIAVYIGFFGKRRPVKKDIKITYIQPKSKLGFPAFFDKHMARKNFCLGYNDTMKTYGKLEGMVYTFKSQELSSFYEIESLNILNILNDLFKYKPKILIPRRLRDKNNKIYINKDKFINSIEFMANLFNIEESKIYSVKKFNKLLIKNYLNINNSYNTFLSKLKFRIFRNRRYVTHKIYTNLLSIDKQENKRKISRLSIIYPRVLIGSIYLYLLLRKAEALN